MKWGNYPIPKADFIVNKSLIKPGEEVSFTNLSSETAEYVKWTFEGGNIETSSEQNPVVVYDKQGVYNVTLIAGNTSGEDTKTMMSCIVVSDKASMISDTLAINKPVEATSYIHDGEKDSFAVDSSLNTKWCAVGDGPHAITIDLAKNCTVTAIQISHAQAGNESKDFNTRAYTISTSLDGTNYEKLISVTDNTKGVSYDQVQPVVARYVKLTVDQATQGGDKAARIYDIKVVGIDSDILN